MIDALIGSTSRQDEGELTPEEVLLIEQEFAEGVALLDTEVPDWACRIRTEGLDMQSCHECLLGQLYGSFDDGWHRVVATSRPGYSAMGFDVPLDLYPPGTRPPAAAYRLLTRLALGAIEERING